MINKLKRVLVDNVYEHLRTMLFSPRIGPDMYLTHWLLYFKPLRVWFQKRKIHYIGNNSEIRPFVSILGTNNVIIGDNVVVRQGALFCASLADSCEKIIIEDDVLIASNVSIYSVTHNYSDISVPVSQQGHKFKQTVVKRGAWLGTNSVILPGVTVGRNSVVGANSVVCEDVPDYTVVGGVPAKTIKHID